MHLLVENKAEYVVWMARAYGYVDLGMEKAETLEHRREHVGRDRGRRREHENPACTLAKLRQYKAAVHDGVERPLCVRQERATAGREPDSTGITDDKFRADRALQRLQPGRERRLRDEEALGRARDAPLPAGLDESLELAQEHRHIDEADRSIEEFNLTRYLIWPTVVKVAIAIARPGVTAHEGLSNSPIGAGGVALDRARLAGGRHGDEDDEDGSPARGGGRSAPALGRLRRRRRGR
jgi:hypothetical protein